MDLFLATTYELLSRKKAIKICPTCTFPFVPIQRSELTYCSYFNGACKEEGRRTKEKERYNKEPNRSYTIIYNQFHNKMNESSNATEWSSLQIDFSDKFIEYKTTLNEDDLMAWLYAVKAKFKGSKDNPFTLPDL